MSDVDDDNVAMWMHIARLGAQVNALQVQVAVLTSFVLAQGFEREALIESIDALATSLEQEGKIVASADLRSWIAILRQS